jgi:hypothetical protein
MDEAVIDEAVVLVPNEDPDGSCAATRMSAPPSIAACTTASAGRRSSSASSGAGSGGCTRPRPTPPGAGPCRTPFRRSPGPRPATRRPPGSSPGPARQVRLGQVGDPDRDPLGVRHDLHLHPVADFGFPDFGPPFCAGTNVASANNSDTSTPPAASSSSTAALPAFLPHPGRRPLLVPPPPGAPGPILLQYIPPRDVVPELVHDPLERFPVVGPGRPPSGRGGPSGRSGRTRSHPIHQFPFLGGTRRGKPLYVHSLIAAPMSPENTP